MNIRINIATVTINTVDKNQSKSVYMNGRNIGRIRIETDTTSGTSVQLCFGLSCYLQQQL